MAFPKWKDPSKSGFLVFLWGTFLGNALPAPPTPSRQHFVAETSSHMPNQSRSYTSNCLSVFTMSIRDVTPGKVYHLALRVNSSKYLRREETITTSAKCTESFLRPLGFKSQVTIEILSRNEHTVQNMVRSY